MSFDHIWNRVKRLREEMALKKIDGILLLDVEHFGAENVFYLSGFRGTSAAVLITQDEALLATDGRYAAQASSQSPFKLLVQTKDQTLLDMAKEMIAGQKVSLCGFEGETVTYGTYKSMEAIQVKWLDVNGMVLKIRRKKDSHEISIIEKTAKIAADAYELMLKDVVPGMTELEICQKLEDHIISLGGEGGWPDGKFIVASGVRSSLPHGRASDKVVKKGDWITVDFGASYGGYMSDLTRNFSLGPVSDPEFLRIHDLLLEAHRKGAEAIGPGKLGKEIDGISRKIISDAGYGDYFGHGLGHGLGVEIHETPRLSPRSIDVLAPGDVVTVEPGIYLPDRGGLRIEDDYLVTENGSRRLSQGFSQEFRVLDL